MTNWEGCCQRCSAKTNCYTMSMYSTELICMGCKDKEAARPDYKDAVEGDLAEIAKGNYNFEGIGYKE